MKLLFESKINILTIPMREKCFSLSFEELRCVVVFANILSSEDLRFRILFFKQLFKRAIFFAILQKFSRSCKIYSLSLG